MWNPRNASGAMSARPPGSPEVDRVRDSGAPPFRSLVYPRGCTGLTPGGLVVVKLLVPIPIRTGPGVWVCVGTGCSHAAR